MNKLHHLYEKAMEIKEKMYKIGITAGVITVFTLGLDFGLTGLLSTSSALSILIVGTGISAGSYFIAINKSKEIQIILS